MLLRLALEEFVLFDAAALEFGPGLNVLSGETGAGKSILIDALGLLAGGRASADWIRTGADRLSVEGTFDLAQSNLIPTLREAGVRLDESNLLLLRREVGRDGRSRAYANGRSVLVSDLKAWTAGLLRLVSQGDARDLEAASALEGLLDREAESIVLARAYGEQRALHQKAREQLDELSREANDLIREEDWLRHQRDEIAAAELRPGEREEVLAALKEARVKRDAAELLEEARARLARDEGSVLDHLETLAHRFRGAPELSELESELLALRDAARALARRLDESDGDAADPAALENRLHQLDRLRKKYGRDEEGILAHLEELESKLDRIGSLETERAAAEAGAEANLAELLRVGEALSTARRQAATRLTETANRSLSQLAMKGAALAFEFTRGAPGEGGLDRIALRFRSHPTEEWGSLGRVASGGELSRVLLALVSAGGGRRQRAVAWVFDEIDSGIGGETANHVAEHLACLARSAQVLLVTHLPVIAARAERQLRVRKFESLGRPHAEVAPVERDARLGELARMLSGDEQSVIARRHAEDLLTTATKPSTQSGKKR